ncbi:MAG: hypothetical protein HYY96_03705 [Candidatus Tectomicrobia bacterium]|nr:hypothetical protein [Candidatus Tectomicrobia bacterium]
MGLVARVVEAAGIPTLYLGLARDIAMKVKPPRTVFLDYPLGNTAGRPNDPANQRAVLRAFLATLSRFSEPGSIVDLPFTWNGDDRSWEADMRALYLAAFERATMKRQRILGENLTGFEAELRQCDETLCWT